MSDQRNVRHHASVPAIVVSKRMHGHECDSAAVSRLFGRLLVLLEPGSGVSENTVQMLPDLMVRGVPIPLLASPHPDGPPASLDADTAGSHRGRVTSSVARKTDGANRSACARRHTAQPAGAAASLLRQRLPLVTSAIRECRLSARGVPFDATLANFARGSLAARI